MVKDVRECEIVRGRLALTNANNNGLRLRPTMGSKLPCPVDSGCLLLLQSGATNTVELLQALTLAWAIAAFTLLSSTFIVC